MKRKKKNKKQINHTAEQKKMANDIVAAINCHRLKRRAHVFLRMFAADRN